MDVSGLIIYENLFDIFFSAAVLSGVLEELEKMEEEIGPRYFWMSLRSNSGCQEMEHSIQKALSEFEVSDFNDCV